MKKSFFFVLLISGSLAFSAEQKKAAEKNSEEAKTSGAGIAAGAGAGVSEQKSDTESKIKFVKVKNETPDCSITISAYYSKPDKFLPGMTEEQMLFKGMTDFNETIIKLHGRDEIDLPLFPSDKINDKGETLIFLCYYLAIRTPRGHKPGTTIFKSDINVPSSFTLKINEDGRSELFW